MIRIKKADTMLYYLICIFSITIKSVFASETNRKTTRRDRYQEVERFEEIYLILRNTMLVAFAPIVFRLLYSLYKDPATPLLWKAMVNAIKKKFGNLSDDGRWGRVQLHKEDHSFDDDLLSDSDDSY
jgi:hypothetical protein